jgi:hypothetical protein
VEIIPLYLLEVESCENPLGVCATGTSFLEAVDMSKDEM